MEHLDDVEVSERQVLWHEWIAWRRTYSTPVGQVFQTCLREPGVGQWHGNRSWRDVSPWQTERLIIQPDYYAAVQYMAEHTQYEADYHPVEQAGC